MKPFRRLLEAHLEAPLEFFFEASFEVPPPRHGAKIKRSPQNNTNWERQNKPSRGKGKYTKPGGQNKARRGNEEINVKLLTPAPSIYVWPGRDPYVRVPVYILSAALILSILLADLAGAEPTYPRIYAARTNRSTILYTLYRNASSEPEDEHPVELGLFAVSGHRSKPHGLAAIMPDAGLYAYNYGCIEY